MDPLLERHFMSLSENTYELYANGVSLVDGQLSSLEFHRNYVSANLPVLLKGAINHWPAVGKWNADYFRQAYGEKEVSVAVTPNGYADNIATSQSGEKFFVEPENRKLKLSEFLDVLDQPENYSGIFYIQKQDSNFLKEFSDLLPDVKPDISWASAAFDQHPTAVNLWMGDHRAITSLHKDTYENMYCVISGSKTFTLYPPLDRPWLPYKTCRLASYKEKSPGHFEIIPTTLHEFLHESKMSSSGCECERCSDLQALSKKAGLPCDSVPMDWIDIDVLRPDYAKYPLFRNARRMKVTVEAGDVLYLPTLWFHHVMQSHACIALNYWYELPGDCKFGYYQFLEELSKAAVGHRD